MPLNGCTKKNEAFVSKGFRNWKKALEKFKEHEISDCHRTANDEISIQKQGHDIAESLVSDHEKQKESNRLVFLNILRNIKYLARQNIPLRGHDEEQSNFIQIFKRTAETDSTLMSFFSHFLN